MTEEEFCKLNFKKWWAETPSGKPVSVRQQIFIGVTAVILVLFGFLAMFPMILFIIIGAATGSTLGWKRARKREWAKRQEENRSNINIDW